MGLIWPAQALADAVVRFIHAVPGVGTATVDVNNQTIGSIGFGQVTPYESVRSGSFQWKLTGASKVLASGTSTVGNGTYDIAILAAPSGAGVRLGIYPASSATSGKSLVRVIHAAPELGQPMFMLDAQTLADRLSYGTATPYYAIKPGMYTISAMKPSLMAAGDPTLIDDKDVTFAPGTAYTAFAIGSRGQMVRVVTVTDKGAPLMRPVSFTKAKPKEASATSGSVMVAPGDSLWAIASRTLGPSASDEQIAHKVVAIWDMNKARIGTGDPNLIFPGQRLTLPS